MFYFLGTRDHKIPCQQTQQTLLYTHREVGGNTNSSDAWEWVQDYPSQPLAGRPAWDSQMQIPDMFFEAVPNSPKKRGEAETLKRLHFANSNMAHL